MEIPKKYRPKLVKKSQAYLNGNRVGVGGIIIIITRIICAFLDAHTRAGVFFFFGGLRASPDVVTQVADRTMRSLQVDEHLNWLSSNIGGV